jgi:hypothetical protein
VLVAQLDAPERAVLLDVVDGVIDLLGGGLRAAARPGDETPGPVPGLVPGVVPGPAEADERREPGLADDPFARLQISSEPVAPPTDPALRRLLPDASADPVVAAELRRLTEADLRHTKVERLRTLRATLHQAQPDVVVVPSEAVAVAGALTDVRLVLAERLELADDADADEVYDLAVASGPAADEMAATRRFVAAVYTVLTELQESLLQLMVADLPPDPRPGGRRRAH